MYKIKKIDYCTYNLDPLVKLNRFNAYNRAGVIFRVNNCFFLDYHPWLEFGDLSCADLIESVKCEKYLPFFLMQDLAVEMNKENIPHLDFKNHCFGSKGECLEDSEFAKIKYSENSQILLNEIEFLIEQKIKIRIDFNNGFNKNDCLKLWNDISNKEMIDYFEDPYDFEIDHWNSLVQAEIPLAADRNYFDGKRCKYKILKPNRDQLHNTLDYSTCIFSNYMGHDLGMYHCYLHLMNKGNLDLFHGVFTPGLYQTQKDIFCKTNQKIHINLDNIKKMYRELDQLVWMTLI